MKKKSARKGIWNTRHRQRNFYCLWFMLALIYIPSPPLSAQPLSADTPLDQARKDLNQIKSRIEVIQARLRKQGRARNEIARDLEDSERRAARLILEGRRIKSVQKRLNTSLSVLQNTTSSLRQQRRVLRDQLARQIRVAYALGREGRLKLVLNGQQPGDLPRMLRYHDYFSRARQLRIEELNATYQRLHETLSTIAQQKQRLATLAEHQDEQARALAQQRKKRALALNQKESELNDQRQRLARLKQNEQRLTKLLGELKQAIDDIPAELEAPESFRNLRGKLPWPVQGQVTRRSTAAGQSSQGVVLRAQAGLEVRAIAHGRVVFADWLRGFGQLIIIDHNAGYMSLYGYNQSLLREPGEWVSAGDAIASIGDSGGQTKPGLYFEIRKAGQPLNPIKWCNSQARFKSAAL